MIFLIFLRGIIGGGKVNRQVFIYIGFLHYIGKQCDNKHLNLEWMACGVMLCEDSY